MTDLQDVVIASDRLRLLPVTASYAGDIFREFTPEVTTYMFPKPAVVIEDTLAFLSGAADELARGESLDVVVLGEASGEFLGCAGLHGLMSRTPELGIWIKKPAHGNHYGREADTALASWAFENPDFDYLTYPVDRRNVASRRIPESLGGQVRREYDKVNASGFLLHLLEYQIERGVLKT